MDRRTLEPTLGRRLKWPLTVFVGPSKPRTGFLDMELGAKGTAGPAGSLGGCAVRGGAISFFMKVLRAKGRPRSAGCPAVLLCALGRGRFVRLPAGPSSRPLLNPLLRTRAFGDNPPSTRPRPTSPDLAQSQAKPEKAQEAPRWFDLPRPQFPHL